MNGRSLGHRAPLLWLVLPLIAGLAVGKITELRWTVPFLVLALAAALASLSVCRCRGWIRHGWGVGLVASMFCAGLGSYAWHRARLPAWDALPPREASVMLEVTHVFAQADSTRATGLGTILASDTHLRELAGQRIYFSLTLRKKERAPIRSAVISAIGILVTVPANPPADTFDGYLAGAGMNFRLTRGRVLAQPKPPHAYYRFCAEAATRFHAILGIGIAVKRPALAGLLRAMMLGATHELSEEQHTLFMQSGTMHLFAISGLNIGVIASSLQALLLIMRLPSWLRFGIGAALLWLFVDITGAAPSAVRAFAMTVFVQAAFVLRRPSNLLAALTASAFAVVVISPLQVFSASFLMSYGIVVALLVLGAPLGEAWLRHGALWRDLPKPAWEWWRRLIDHGWRALMSAIAVGLATSLVGLITGVQFFGLLTPGSLLANLLLIPAAVIVTLGGFASLVAGLAGFTLGASLCNHAAALVLLVIEWLVRVSVTFPGAFIPAHFVASWIGPVTLTALMAALLLGYAGAWSRRSGSWWPPFALVVLTLALGVKFG